MRGGEYAVGNEYRMDPDAEQFLKIMGLSALGGGLNYFRHHPRGCFHALECLLCIALAAFAGIEAHYLASWLDLDPDLAFAVAGIAGYGGGVLLDAGVQAAKDALKSKISRQ